MGPVSVFSNTLDNTLDVVVNPATDRVYVSNNCGFIDVIEDLAEIHGMKWDDLNADGVRDPGEPGLEGVRINLYALTPPDDLGDLFRATFTDADGNYSFLDVPPGFYRVEETPFGQTFPPDGQPHFIQLGQGERGILKKCVNSQAVYPLSEQHGLKARERRYTAHEEGKHWE